MPKSDYPIHADGHQASRPDNFGKTGHRPEFVETVLNLVVAIFFYSMLSYAFMEAFDWKPWKEWSLVIVGAVVIVLLYIPLTLSETRYVFKVLGPYVVVLLIVLAAVIGAVPLPPKDKSDVFKEFIIIYFSFLPSWLYLQFLATKGKTIWDEYVLALFRLGVDDCAFLPKPPVESRYYQPWREKHPEPNEQEQPNTYQKKFEARFGPVGTELATGSAVLRGENLWPVAIASLLIAVGWRMVATRSNLSSVGPLDPLEPFRFGFLGAYFYVLQMLVRRYFQSDLKTDAYVQATMRFIVVTLLIWTLESVYKIQASRIVINPDTRCAIAFLIGIFPHIGLQALITVLKMPMQIIIPSVKPRYPLSELDGLNVWYESRLLEEESRTWRI